MRVRRSTLRRAAVIFAHRDPSAVNEVGPKNKVMTTDAKWLSGRAPARNVQSMRRPGSDTFDLVVVGGGAGGLVAAKEARRRGARVALVQDGPPGGDCTFTGCVPSKTLLAAAARAAADGTGFAEAMGQVRAVVQRIAATEDAASLAAEGIEVIPGFGRFVSRRRLEVAGRTVQARRWVVATGARPHLPPVAGLAEAAPLTSETIFDLTRPPPSLAILGGGPIGCELAQAFARLGVPVTLVEAEPALLPREEPEAAAVVARHLAAGGVSVRTGATVQRIERAGQRTTLHLHDGELVEAAALLVATGRAPSGRGLGLEEIGVELDPRGAVVVDDAMATSVAGIWAAGDVVGRAQLTHAAARMGWIAASNALWTPAKLRPFRYSERVLPAAVFTSPEVGRVGLTEAQAAARHPGAMVAHLPLDRVDRALTSGETDGFVRLIAVPARGVRHPLLSRLAGATVVAPNGGDLVHEAALAMQANLVVGRLAQTSHAYPTWASAIQQAALQFLGPSNGLRARPARP
jgi:pyruvate/2-oxoglutarate dehydrogenase complex dihydrolipoamide dehydrogenase (E3) component